jgi:hypothetical protein
MLSSSGRVGMNVHCTVAMRFWGEFPGPEGTGGAEDGVPGLLYESGGGEMEGCGECWYDRAWILPKEAVDAVLLGWEVVSGGTEFPCSTVDILFLPDIGLLKTALPQVPRFFILLFMNLFRTRNTSAPSMTKRRTTTIAAIEPPDSPLLFDNAPDELEPTDDGLWPLGMLEGVGDGEETEELEVTDCTDWVEEVLETEVVVEVVETVEVVGLRGVRLRCCELDDAAGSGRTSGGREGVGV